MRKLIIIFPILIVFLAFIVSFIIADKNTVDNSLSSTSFFETPNDSDFKSGSPLLHYTGHIVSYNPETLQPDWVAYTLTAEQVEETKHTPKIPRHFMPDPNLDFPQASNEDYSGSGWVRGHMARRQDMKWSEQAVMESDYYTNICPQDKEMNQHVWHQIENLARKVAVKYDSVQIVCGPIFTSPTPETIGIHDVPIPDYFFKAFLIKQADTYHTIAFLCPNRGDSLSIMQTIQSVNDVEDVTGLDLFEFLDDRLEESVEEEVNASWWMR